MTSFNTQPPTPVQPSPPRDSARLSRDISPADSDRTLVAPTSCKATEPMSYVGPAHFSTDCGRLPRREPPGPPFPPVIVRSDKIRGVVQCAHYWLNKDPYLYHHFFPNSGWTITDLWDNADIHLDSPGFLQEVLGFITRDNVVRANQFAVQWSRTHPDKAQLAGGDLVGLYDFNHDPVIVDKIFTDGEIKQYPPVFLWHALNMMRHSWWNVSKAQQAEAAAASEAQGAVQTGAPGSVPVKESQSGSGAGSSSHLPAGIPTSSQPPLSTTLRPTGPAVPPVRPTSFASSAYTAQPAEPSRGYPVQPAAYGDGDSAGPISRQIGSHSLRNFRSRPTRSGSGSSSYNQPLQTHSGGDNVRMSSGPHNRLPSGLLSAGQSPRFGPPVPFGMAMGMGMTHPLNPIAPLPPNAALGPYGPVMQQGFMNHQLNPHMSGLDGSQPIPPSSAGLRAVPFSDMTNSLHYAAARGVDPHSRTVRHTNQVYNQRPLYNPYGAERPDKADFANVAGQSSRKGGRSSFSNPPGRDRKMSIGSYNRGYGQNSIDRADSLGIANNRHSTETHSSSPRYHYTQINPQVINDKQGGCGEDWIGPNNQDVFELWVGELPADVTEDNLRDLFYNAAKVKVKHVNLKTAPLKITHAFAYFDSVNDARKGLQANGARLRTKQLSVKVPRRYFMLSEPDIPLRERRVPSAHTFCLARAPSYSTRSIGDNGAEPERSVQYSPQDARSDLRYIPRQKKQESSTASGSPQMHKAKQHPTITNEAADSESRSLSYEKKAESITAKLNVVHEGSTSMEVKYSQRDEASQLRSERDAAKVDEASQGCPSIQEKVRCLSEASHNAEEAATLVSDGADEVPTAEMELSDMTDSSTTQPKLSLSGVITIAETVPVEMEPSATTGSSIKEPKLSLSGITTVADIVPTKMEHSTTTDSSTMQPKLSPSGVTAVAEIEPGDALIMILKSPQEDERQPRADIPALSVDDITPRSEDPVKPSVSELIEHAVSTEPTQPHEGTTSDDEQKQDLSFHSAQESQLDPVKPGLEEIFSPMAERVGSETEPCACMPLDDSFGTSMSTPNHQYPVPPKAEDPKANEQHPKEVTDPQNKPSSEAGKLHGAKQTQSLHPFAKASKSQAKKEKDAKKKEKRKGKEKIKTEKTTSADVDWNDDQLLKDNAGTAKNAPTESSHAPASVDGETDIAMTSSVVGHSTIPSVSDTGSSQTDQKTGNESHAPGNIVPVTQKQELPPEPLAQRAPPNDALLQDSVQSHEEKSVDAPAVPRNRPESESVSVALLGGTQGQQALTKPKRARDKVAVPDLKHLQRKTSASSTSSPLFTAHTTKPLSSGAPSPTSQAMDAREIGQAGDAGSSHHAKVPDTASVASSVTPRAFSSPPSLVASPTDDFLTPVPSPTPASPPAEPAKKKKKKNKKKKKLASKAIEPITSTDSDAFLSQLCEIEGVRNAQEEVQAQAEASSSTGSGDAADNGGKKKSMRSDSFIREIHQFTMEKAASYSRMLASNIWSEEGRKPVKRLEVTELAEIIDGPKRSTALQRLLDDAELPEDQQVPKAGSKPFFHD